MEKNIKYVSGSKLIKTTFLVMFATALSRVIGYVREVVVAAYYGTGFEVDAYRVAIQLPNLFRLIMGDTVIAAAFIPIFSSYLAKNREEEGWEVSSRIIVLTTILMIVLTLLGEIFALPLIRVLAPGFAEKPETMSLAISLTRIMFPALIFMVLGGLFSGILNSYKIFFRPAISPVIWNLVTISFIVVLSGLYGIYAFATGLLVASILQSVIQTPFFAFRKKLFKLKADFRHPEVIRFLVLLTPIIISSATSNINTIIDTRFASYLTTGVVAALGYAIRIYLVPAGVFGVAVSTVLFPRLSEFEALNEEKKFRENLSYGMRVLVYIMFPVTSFFFFFALPMVRILFERGAFKYSDSLLTAAPLAMYSLGLIAYSLTTLLSRAYYSKQDSKTPLYIAGISIIVNYFGDWFFMKIMPEIPSVIPSLERYEWLFAPHAGIALSTSLVAVFQFVLLSYLYVRMHGQIGATKILKSSAMSAFATTAATIVAYLAYSRFFEPEKLQMLIALIIAFLVGAICYAGITILMRMEEAIFAFNLLKQKTGSRSR